MIKTRNKKNTCPYAVAVDTLNTVPLWPQSRNRPSTVQVYVISATSFYAVRLAAPCVNLMYIQHNVGMANILVHIHYIILWKLLNKNTRVVTFAKLGKYIAVTYFIKNN